LLKGFSPKQDRGSMVAGYLDVTASAVDRIANAEGLPNVSRYVKLS